MHKNCLQNYAFILFQCFFQLPSKFAGSANIYPDSLIKIHLSDHLFRQHPTLCDFVARLPYKPAKGNHKEQQQVCVAQPGGASPNEPLNRPWLISFSAPGAAGRVGSNKEILLMLWKLGLPGRGCCTICQPEKCCNNSHHHHRHHQYTALAPLLMVFKLQVHYGSIEIRFYFGKPKDEGCVKCTRSEFSCSHIYHVNCTLRHVEGRKKDSPAREGAKSFPAERRMVVVRK